MFIIIAEIEEVIVTSYGKNLEKHISRTAPTRCFVVRDIHAQPLADSSLFYSNRKLVSRLSVVSQWYPSLVVVPVFMLSAKTPNIVDLLILFLPLLLLASCHRNSPFCSLSVPSTARLNPACITVCVTMPSRDGVLSQYMNFTAVFSLSNVKCVFLGVRTTRRRGHECVV